MAKRLVFMCVLLISSININAATFTYLKSPALVGDLNGLDLLWGTTDDFTAADIPGLPAGFTGFNPEGGATNFLFDTSLTFGSVVGSFETSGPVQLGVNTLTSLNADVYTNDFSSGTPTTLDSLGGELQETLSPNGTSTITLAANNSASSSMFIDLAISAGVNDFFTLTGNYSFLNNGEDADVIFAGAADVISQFNFIVPLLPDNWDKVFIGNDNFVFAEGGGLGNQSAIFYTTSAVPLPPAVWLFGSALLGLIGVSRKN